MNASTAARDAVIRRAPYEPEVALAAAREVPDPWFRCQALAWVARYAAEPAVNATADEALDAARRAGDPYRATAVVAWPIRALLERGRRARAADLLADALGRASRIELLVSRSDALLLLLHAVFDDAPLRATVLPMLRDACMGTPSWKGGYVARSVVLMLAGVDRAAAASLSGGMPPGRYRRSAERWLAEGRTASPRRFFWSPAC